MVNIAYALGQSGAAAQGGSGGLAAFIPFILMFVVFYFLLIRPQQKKTKLHREMINNLKKGDKVLTSGGLHGTITGLDESVCTVEIADRVRVKIARANISGLDQPVAPAPAKKK